MNQDLQKGGQEDKLKLRQIIMIAVITLITACCIILFYFCVERYQGLGAGWDKLLTVAQGIIFGFIFAFLMNPFMVFFEQRMLPFFIRHCKTEQKAKKTTRIVTTLIALVILFGIFTLTIVAIIPELYRTVAFLVTHIGDQIDGVLEWANDITGGRYEEVIMSAKGSAADMAIDKGLELAQNYIADMGPEEMVSFVANSVIGVGRTLVNLIIGMIVSVYVLCSKEIFKGQTKKIMYGVLKTEHANILLEISRKAADIFYGFIIGKILDSLIIGIICYVCMVILNMPYAMLVSTIIGVTNVIPVFGPYIGAVPTVIIIFLTEPMQGIYFLILVIALQQLDGNIIGPKILGDSTGLSAFWVVVAIVVGGGLFGLPGMLIGVPTMALIYYLVGLFVKYLLRKKNLPEETSAYMHLDHIDAKSKALIEHDEEYNSKTRVKIFGKKKEEKDKDSETKE